jgi:hypothetical protein
MIGGPFTIGRCSTSSASRRAMRSAWYAAFDAVHGAHRHPRT